MRLCCSLKIRVGMHISGICSKGSSPVTALYDIWNWIQNEYQAIKSEYDNPVCCRRRRISHCSHTAARCLVFSLTPSLIRSFFLTVCCLYVFLSNVSHVCPHSLSHIVLTRGAHRLQLDQAQALVASPIPPIHPKLFNYGKSC